MSSLPLARMVSAELAAGRPMALGHDVAPKPGRPADLRAVVLHQGLALVLEVLQVP
jgi:hypothetical protein